MPTENRSSNTDPRDVFIRLNPLGLGEEELRKDNTGFEDQRTHSDYLLFLAGYRESHPEPLQHTEQHQGEPVAWQIRSKTNRPESQWTPWKECCEMTRAMHSHEVGRFNQFGIMREIRPVYTHTDPGEVERLRAENEAFDAGMRNLACQLSAGGYNANSLTAAQLLEKVQWGLTHLTEAHARLVDSLRAQLADLEKLHGGELGLPKEGWPEYHKRKMETLRNLTAGHYERKLAERDALLQRMKTLFRTDDPFDLYDVVCAALSASADPSAPGVLPRAHDVNMFQRTAQPGAKS